MSVRRDFLRKSALVMAAAPLINREMIASSGPSGKTGLVLYTIRDAMGLEPSAACTADSGRKIMSRFLQQGRGEE